jgi:hypothetical protein
MLPPGGRQPTYDVPKIKKGQSPQSSRRHNFANVVSGVIPLILLSVFDTMGAWEVRFFDL